MFRRRVIGEAVQTVMKTSRPVGRSIIARWRGGALALIRPGAEMALLAGVAIGCAQIGWRIASPELPDLSVADVSPDGSAEAVAADNRSPFAPLQFAEAAAATVHADLSGIRVVGLRVAPKAEHSGAVLILGDGAQRSFLVGYEIIEGVRLEAIETGHIVVSLGDDEQIIPLDRAAPARPSLALALLGRPQPDFESAASMVASNTPAWTGDRQAEIVSLPLGREQDLAGWLLATSGQIETRNGAPFAWRAASFAPQQVIAAGVEAGDLIVSVNGAGPNSGQSQLVSAASAGPLTLEIERKSGQRIRLQVTRGL
jgi:hypothetical protein